MKVDNLGKLESVDLREVWEKEAEDFTPWLSEPANLSELAKALEIEIDEETVKTEVRVGSFCADILCQESITGFQILIENQLERTNHKHLGQLLTYAAGLKAAVIIWIADRFTEEHRAALDWLNNATDERFRFFGIEIELWKIGNSQEAPKFNIVAKPNEWSRSIRPSSGADSERDRFRKAYWTALNEVLEGKSGAVAGNRKPQPANYMSYPIGKSGFNLATVMSTQKRRLSVELYLTGNNAKPHFFLLEERKAEIEADFDKPLDWQQLPTKNASRIAYYNNDVDIKNEGDWPKQHEWLATHINKLHEAFADRVKEVDADDWEGDTESSAMDD